MKNNVVKGLVGLVISIGLILWMFYVIDWDEVGSQLLELNYLVVIPALLIFIIHYLLRAYRWKFLLPEKEVSQRLLFDSILLGAFATFILPLRAGEFIRPVFLTTKSEYSFSSAFVSVVIERFFDLSMVLFTFGLILPLVPDLPNWAYQGAVSLSVLAGIIFIFILLGIFIPEQLQKINGVCLRFVPKKLRCGVEKFLDDLLMGARVLNIHYNWLKVGMLTVVVWLSCYLLFYTFLLFFNFEPSILMAITISVVIALAVAAPSAPGFIGVYQTACIAAFILFGHSKETAITYSLISHIFQYILFVCYGIYTLSTTGLKFKDFIHITHE